MTEVIDYLFLIEHEDREGQLVRLLTSMLNDKGFSCKVLSIEFHLHLINRYSPRVLVFPYAIDSSRYPLCIFHGARFSRTKFVSLNWEQLLSASNKKFKSPKCDIVKNRVHHLAWDDEFKVFLEESGVSSDKVTVIGNPNVELLYKAMASTKEDIVSAKLKLGLQPNASIIFFPMNYGWAFSTDTVIRGKIKQGYDCSVAWEYRDYSYQCLVEFVSFVSSLSKTYNNAQIVIRPHPSISIEQYIDVFKKLNVSIPSNLKITKSYTVKEWMAVSDIVGSSWSTTVWDCHQMGIPAFLFTPIKRPVWLNIGWNDQVNNISSVEQFVELFVAKGSSVSAEFKYIDNIFKWLLSVNDVNNSELLGYNFLNDFNFKTSLYKARCGLRCFSAKYLNGIFVSKGAMRDYFDVRSDFRK
ncbi:hypothetical protein [Shewanella spartinae]|uniref:hypothetical protein n=1 Tax=Shewanella spartinae TaxID=2864205 RepID=UPI001C65718E|nr:hypothetical protein [Shewanella spartinae]QYJ95158.1 hypothetical protein K0I31_07185 [Shewanella spartinae]